MADNLMAKILLLTNAYPSDDDLYKNAFVHQRVKAYKSEGLQVDVLRFRPVQEESRYEFDGVTVTKGNPVTLHGALANGGYGTVLVHFLDEFMWDTLKDFTDGRRFLVWLHGSEVQPWRRREFNLENEQDKEAEKRRSMHRTALWQEVFYSLLAGKIDARFVFVSDYFANEVMQDYGIRLPGESVHIIHNFIDAELFAYAPKDASQRLKILSIRPFASKKYANDLTVKAILELSKLPFFNELSFRVIGDGALFDATAAPLRGLGNVLLEKRFLKQAEIAELHRQYGVFLVPTRMDAQGVSRDEAMASGLVPVTNAVAAIPEFVDGDCGMLAPPEDHAALAAAIARLYREPELFCALSQSAARRVRRQSGFEQTIRREIDLIRGVQPAP